ncbi:MAG: hypothetical protein ACEPOW_04015 [Bacteroidales bacterium]
MEVDFVLKREDYLTNILFAASESNGLKKRKWSARIMLGVVFAFFAYQGYSENKISLLISFVIIGLFSVVYFSRLQSYFFKRNYLKVIDKQLNEKLEVKTYVDLSVDKILIKDEFAKAEIDWSKIKKGVDIGNYIILIIGDFQSVIFPSNMSEFAEFKIEIRDILKSKDIFWEEKKNWKWK